MDKNNMTEIFIHLLGLQPPQNIAIWVFFLFLMLYCITICGNLLIITLVSYSKTLHTAMYFFLLQLSMLDILLSTSILPNMLHSFFVKKQLMQFSQCLTQFFFFATAEGSECLILTVMSYDRYVAICRPLHYILVMSRKFCCLLVIASWTFPIFISVAFMLTILHMQFSGSAIIDHFFCELYTILEISSSDTTFFQLIEKLLGVTLVITPFCFIIVSYIFIIIAIFKMSSVSGRQKAFSTCSSHMTVVCIFYGTLICIYVLSNRGQLRKVSKYLSLLYTVITPMINPIIYSLRNKELNCALRQLFK